MPTQVPETQSTNKKRFACDGGDDALGHPRVWLQIPEPQGWVECPYCDCKYIYQDDPAAVA